MAEPIDQELASRYRRWETADLVRATTVDAADYRPEALVALRHELECRQPIPEAVEETPDPPDPPEDRLRGVGGLLALMIYAIGSHSVDFLREGIRIFQPYLLATANIAGLIIGSLGLFGLASCWLLLRIDPRAPRSATRWCLLVTAAGVVALAVRLLTGKAPPADALAFPFDTLLWLVYLKFSQRVEITYGSPGRQEIAETVAAFEQVFGSPRDVPSR
ncbi:MAG TPA: hypothetical protein VMW75_28710 [Thermoanaerobaculia bacterium]|nr:hypothetical protein [Thermoanaerobaculia bacterium]